MAIKICEKGENINDNGKLYQLIIDGNVWSLEDYCLGMGRIYR